MRMKQQQQQPPTVHSCTADSTGTETLQKVKAEASAKRERKRDSRLMPAILASPAAVAKFCAPFFLTSNSCPQQLRSSWVKSNCSFLPPLSQDYLYRRWQQALPLSLPHIPTARPQCLHYPRDRCGRQERVCRRCTYSRAFVRGRSFLLCW